MKPKLIFSSNPLTADNFGEQILAKTLLYYLTTTWMEIQVVLFRVFVPQAVGEFEE